MGVFCTVGDDGVLGDVVGVGLVSIVDESVRVSNKCRRSVQARQDVALSSRGGVFQTHSFCCDWQLLNLEFAAPDSKSKSACFNSDRLRSVTRTEHEYSMIPFLLCAMTVRDDRLLGSSECKSKTSTSYLHMDP